MSAMVRAYIYIQLIQRFVDRLLIYGEFNYDVCQDQRDTLAVDKLYSKDVNTVSVRDLVMLGHCYM